jgi:hypothetical protein
VSTRSITLTTIYPSSKLHTTPTHSSSIHRFAATVSNALSLSPLSCRETAIFQTSVQLAFQVERCSLAVQDECFILACYGRVLGWERPCLAKLDLRLPSRWRIELPPYQHRLQAADKRKQSMEGHYTWSKVTSYEKVGRKTAFNEGVLTSRAIPPTKYIARAAE